MMDSPSHRHGGPIKWTRPRDAWNSQRDDRSMGWFFATWKSSSQEGRKWLLTMVIVSPLRIGVFPLQMAVSWPINGGYQPLTNWHDPPSTATCLFCGRFFFLSPDGKQSFLSDVAGGRMF